SLHVFLLVFYSRSATTALFSLSLHRRSSDLYPVVPRLGLQWRVSNAIVIKGGAYFALTSEALMAGLEVEVSADFGFAWARIAFGDRKSTRLNSSHVKISYAVFCLKKKKRSAT